MNEYTRRMIHTCTAYVYSCCERHREMQGLGYLATCLSLRSHYVSVLVGDEVVASKKNKVPKYLIGRSATK